MRQRLDAKLGCNRIELRDQFARQRHAVPDPVFAAREGYATLSSLWSHHLVKRPENQLTGVGFLWGGYHKSHGQLMDASGAFTVHQPDHWLFAGTGLKRDEGITLPPNGVRTRLPAGPVMVVNGS